MSDDDMEVVPALTREDIEEKEGSAMKVGPDTTVTVSVSRPEQITYKGVNFVLEASVLQRLRHLFMALEIDLEENVTLDQVLYLCQHTDIPDSDIAYIFHIVVPEKRNADIISAQEFVAVMSMINLCLQNGLECPQSLGELAQLDGTQLVDVGLGYDDRTFSVEPPTRLELGVVEVENIKSRSSGSGIYRHILYDINFALGYGWDHVGVSRTQVQRRYSDFVWLQERFLSKYTAVILPPLPGKKLVGNLDSEFVETRRQALEFYLNRIGEHPLLRASMEFCIFISSSPRGMDALQKFCAPLKTTSWSDSAKGLVTSVWSTFGSYVPLVGGSTSSSEEDHATKKSSPEAKDAHTTVAPPALGEDRGFTKMSDKFVMCRAHLGRILERSEDALKLQRSMGLRVAYLGHAVSEMGAAEKSMRIRGTEGIGLVGELLEKVARLNQDTNDEFETVHVAQLKFHVGTLEMAQSLLQSRKELFEQERDAHRKRLKAKKAYATARAGSSSNAHSAALKAADSKQRAEKEINESVQRVTAATRGIEKEVKRFEAAKAENLRTMLSKTANVMQQSNLRQKLLWADLARVLSTLSYQNSSSSSGSPRSDSSRSPTAR